MNIAGPNDMPILDLLFVYGTLRRGCDTAEARALNGRSIWGGPARARGLLLRIDWYPAFVPDPAGHYWVSGDLFRMRDPALVLPLLDRYEECAPDFPEPWEYRREIIEVVGPNGAALAWTYVYTRPIDGLERIESGDWLKR